MSVLGELGFVTRDLAPVPSDPLPARLEVRLTFFGTVEVRMDGHRQQFISARDADTVATSLVHPWFVVVKDQPLFRC